MKNLVASLLLTLSLAQFIPSPAFASTQALGTCLTDSLNGKERKELAKWIYFAIAAHPEMSQYSSVSTSDRMQSDEYVGGLVTRLLAEDCQSELRAAQKSDPQAIEKAFEIVGNVAMQELLNDQNVMTAITNYANYADLSIFDPPTEE